MALAAYNTTVVVTSQPSIGTTDEATTTTDSLTYSLSTSAHRYLDPTVAISIQAQYDEAQTITITGTPTGGTYTLTFGGQTTATINYNDPASTVQTRLQALSSIGAGNALVTGGPGPGTAYSVQFAGTLAKANQSAITLAANSLTGGSTPTVAIATVKDGATWATITTGFSVYKAPARVVFTAVQTAGTQVRFHAASYFAYTTLAEVALADFSAKATMADTTVFSTTGVKTYIPTLLEGTLKLTTFWSAIARSTSFFARDLLVVSFTLSTGNRYEGFVYASDMDLKFDPKNAISQDITFQLTNEYFAA